MAEKSTQSNRESTIDAEVVNSLPAEPRKLEKTRRRYGELVDKKFAQSLSKKELKELAKLKKTLDEIEALIYEPVTQALIARRDKLKKLIKSKSRKK